MRRWTKDFDPNTLLIPRDIGERLKVGRLRVRSPKSRPAATPAAGRFDVLPAASTGGALPKDAKTATDKTADAAPAPAGATADKAAELEAAPKAGKAAAKKADYQEAYLKNKAATQKAPDPAEKKRAEEAKQKEIGDYRRQAQELLNQIAWWRQQFGMGQYDDATINGAISDLQYKLGAIPPDYWS